MAKEEIKAKLDALVDTIKRICKMQRELGMYVIHHKNEIVLVYDVEKLFEYAEATNTKVVEHGVLESGKFEIGFSYRGCRFTTFLAPEEYDKIKEKVLPPTKVTEPIRENE